MEKAMITLSFDDGRLDTYNVFMNILKPRNIPATVNIPSGYIETGFSEPLDIGYNGLMTKAQLDKIADDPLFEIAGHGYMHNNELQDIKTGIEKLNEWYPQIASWGFASPHSEMSKKNILSNSNFYNNLEIHYVRVGRKFGKYSFIKRIESLIAKKMHSKFAFNLCYRSSLNKDRSFVLHAIPVMRDTTLEQIESIVEYTVQNKLWCVLEIHGIDKIGSKEYQEIFCWEESKFISLCEFLIVLRDDSKIEIKNAIDIITQGKSKNREIGNEDFCRNVHI